MKEYFVIITLIISINFIYAQQLPWEGIITNHPDNLNINNNEPSVAVNPIDRNNIVVATNYRYYNSNGVLISARTGYYFTTNLGTNWNSGALDNLGYNVNADPSVDFNLNGNVFIGYLATGWSEINNTAILISQSSDEGLTWQSPSIIDQVDWQDDEVELDKPFLTVDKSNISTYKNRIYITYVEIDIEDFPAGGYERKFRRIKSSYSENGDFSNPITINQVIQNSYVINSIPVTDKQGNVFVFFYQRNDDLQTYQIRVVKSTTGGVNFNGFNPAEKIVADIDEISPTNSDFDFRMNSFHSVAVDLSDGNFSNNIYVIWTDYVNISGSDKTDIYLSKSSDSGVSWQNIGKINPESDGDQFFPSISINEDGRINIVYYHMDDRGSGIITTKYITSFDGGNNFYDDDEFANRNFNFNEEDNFVDDFIGDYISIASVNNLIVPVWTSNEYQPTIDKYTEVIHGEIMESKLTVTLNSKLDGDLYNEGVITFDNRNYNSGDTAKYYPQLEYTLSVPSFYDNIGDGKYYKFRYWSGLGIYGNNIIENYKLGYNFLNGIITAEFNNTYPLTVTNNLEGGTGGSYKVTWDKEQNDPEILNSGNSYNAFEYQTALDDKYDIQALNFSAINTNWYFQNWNTGSTNSIISNYQVAAPTSFTADYKGNLASNQTDALTGSSQRKIVRDGNGIYYAVYTSMDKLWYTKSLTTDFNGNWSEEQKILILGLEDANYTNPSIDIYGNTLAILFEE